MAITASSLAACGGSSDDACGAVVAEPRDPASNQHVTAGTDVVYLTDPPTSGPHAVLPVQAGIRDEPLHPTLQVGVLETGRILVQHRDLPASEVAELAALVASEVVIAPNPGLDAPVVATAWQHRLDCERIDVGSLQRFVNEFRGSNVNH